MNKGRFQKGHVPWNKGKTKEVDSRLLVSDETRKKLSEFHHNQVRTPEWCSNISKSLKGKKRYDLLGKKRDASIGKKISQAKMGHTVSEDSRQKMSLAKKGKKIPQEKLLIKTSKEYLTKKRNNSFNTSSVEEEFYASLLKQNENKTIYRNYKDNDRYPFYCDFYIVEDDLFIEVNAHWTHGGMPFDKTNEDCIKQLNEWQEKAKTSKFYANAIETWTVRDVKKQECAKKNKLNYKVVY